MTAAELAAAAEQLIARAVAEQRLPEQLEEPGVIARVVALLGPHIHREEWAA